MGAEKHAEAVLSPKASIDRESEWAAKILTQGEMENISLHL